MIEVSFVELHIMPKGAPCPSWREVSCHTRGTGPGMGTHRGTRASLELPGVNIYSILRSIGSWKLASWDQGVQKVTLSAL